MTRLGQHLQRTARVSGEPSSSDRRERRWRRPGHEDEVIRRVDDDQGHEYRAEHGEHPGLRVGQGAQVEDGRQR